MKETLGKQQVEIANLNREIIRLKEVVCEVKEDLKGAKQELVAIRVEIVDLKLEAKDLKSIIQIETSKLDTSVKEVENKITTLSKYGYAINIFLILAVIGAVMTLILKR